MTFRTVVHGSNHGVALGHIEANLYTLPSAILASPVTFGVQGSIQGAKQHQTICCNGVAAQPLRSSYWLLCKQLCISFTLITEAITASPSPSWSPLSNYQQSPAAILATLV